LLDALSNADGQAVIYSDALEYIDRENELAEGLQLERRLLAKLMRGQDPTASVLKTTLLLYQVRGAIFAACRGRKWERQGWLSEIDQKRILCCIQNMRMVCNSTFLFDKQTHHSPKLQEFREIMTDFVRGGRTQSGGVQRI